MVIGWCVVGVVGGCLVWDGGVASVGKAVMFVVSGRRIGLFARPATSHGVWRSGVAGFVGRKRGGVVGYEGGVSWVGDRGDGWVMVGGDVGVVGV
jgi:hypothetical protein